MSTRGQSRSSGEGATPGVDAIVMVAGHAPGMEERDGVARGSLGRVWGVLVMDGHGGVSSHAHGRDVDAEARVASVLAQHKARQVLVVVPVEQTLARVVALPDDAPTEGEAIDLLVEAHAPAGVASGYRAAGGVVRCEGTPPGLLVTAWHAASEQAAWLREKKIDERAIAPAAGLAALLSAGSLGTSHAWASGEHVIAIARGPKGVVVRQVVEEEASENVMRAVRRDALARAGGEEEDGNAVDWQRVSQVVAGVPRGEPWDGELLPLIGAAVAMRDAGLARCARLSRHAPKVAMPLLSRVGLLVGRPRVAWGMIAAGLMLMVGGPIALSTLRAGLTKEKAEQLEASREKTKDIELKAAVYEQVESTRWPLSKLLADLSGAAPVGVSVKSLRLSAGSPLSIQGEAKSSQQVNELQAALASTRVFTNIKQARVSNKSGGEGVEFDLTADVTNMHTPVKPAEDFSTQTLAVRLYGEGASNTTQPVGAVRQVRRGGGSARASATASTSGGGSSSTSGSSSAASTTRRPSEPPSSEAPATLTDADISKMTSAEAMRGWTTRRTYINRNAGLEAGLKSRLEDEITKLKEQQRKAAASGSSGGAAKEGA